MKTSFLDGLAARRRFGMKPGLDTIRALCLALGNPERRVHAVHVAGTNGKGAVCAMLDACLRAGGLSVGRYTSPHLVRLNERFFLNGAPVSDDMLEKIANRVENTLSSGGGSTIEPTFFEALTAVAFLLYADLNPDFAILETGLGGRLDATNVCSPCLSVITRIGLDHCDWLGDTVEKIASEKAGIVKADVPVVLGRNKPEVVSVVKARAEAVGAPFLYAPDLADESEIPKDFSLSGSFNRENAVTAIAALKVLAEGLRKGVKGKPGAGSEISGSPVPRLRNCAVAQFLKGMSCVVWPGRFQRVGRFIVDGAHNPPAARALAAALAETGTVPALIAGFCGDKDVDETLRILGPHISRAIAVRTNNPRSLDPEALAEKMRKAGIDACPCDSLKQAVASLAACHGPAGTVPDGDVLVCGSLFLAGEALVELGAYPWGEVRFDPSERLKPCS